MVARNLSSRRALRAEGEALFGTGPSPLDDGALSLDDLEAALIAGKIICYTQGFEMIAAASEALGWALPLAEIAKVWRAGCIIRSDMLDDMAAALDASPDRLLAFAPYFAEVARAHFTACPSVGEIKPSHLRQT